MLPRDHYLKQAFQDLAHFPNGFEKGGLSDIQARLIRKNGTLISALCIDEVSDATPDDLHILKVIANQSAPKNPVEQAWVKYLSIVKSQENSSPKGKTSKAKAAKTVAEEEPEPTPEPQKAAPKAAEKAAAKQPAAKAAKATKTEAAKTEVKEPAPAKAAPKAKAAKEAAPAKPAAKKSKA